MIVDCSGAPCNQVLVSRSFGSSATGAAREAEADNIESDSKTFENVVTIGKRLERNAEILISGTVKTLRGGDAGINASQYSSFQGMIYHNLRNVLLWPEEELKKYKGTRQKGKSIPTWYRCSRM
jgi:hypothetical protein